MPDEVLIDGEAKRLIWGADESDHLRAKDYFEGLREQDQKAFRPVFERLAETGQVQNKEKFRSEGGNLFVFKIHKHRLACFFVGRDVILIAGFVKKSTNGRREAREIKTAARLRDAYLKDKS